MGDVQGMEDSVVMYKVEGTQLLRYGKSVM